MVARLQKFIVVSLIVAASGWAYYFIANGQIWWAVLGSALILVGYSLFLATEFLMLYFVQEPGVAPRVGWLDLSRAWWGEVRSAPRVFCWRQPFRSSAEPDHLPPSRGGQRGVVLVHGFVCNRGLWNPWMRALRERDVPYVAINLEPLFGSIDDYAVLVEAAVRRLELSTGAPVVLVGHSMGGLAIRAWLRTFDADARVCRVITIGSPHQGTWLARFGHTSNGRQMRQRNTWLKQLAAAETASRLGLFTCFYGHCDNIVFPASAGTLQGAVNIHLPGTAHVHMAFHSMAFAEALRWITDPIVLRTAVDVTARQS
jgi:triacylglycerol lipase